MTGHQLEPGLYEALLTAALKGRLADLVASVVSPHMRPLADAEAADRFSRHIAATVARAIEAAPEQDRAADHLFGHLGIPVGPLSITAPS